MNYNGLRVGNECGIFEEKKDEYGMSAKVEEEIGNRWVLTVL